MILTMPDACRRVLPLVLAILLLPLPAAAQSDDEFLLISRDLRVEPVRVVQATAGQLAYIDANGERQVRPIDAVLGLVRPGVSPDAPRPGEVRLVDGQRFPGQPGSGDSELRDALIWMNPWFGELQIPLDDLELVRLSRDAPIPEMRDGDVLLLSNGDRLEGFIERLGDPIEFSVGEETLRVPLSRVSSIRLVSTPGRPAENVQRIWFRNGVIADVNVVTMNTDGQVQIEPSIASAVGRQVHQRSLIYGILFHPRDLVPLASLTPSDVDGPPSRYRIPPPTVLDASASLNLSRLELRGPLTVRYAVGDRYLRFAAEAVLPESARQWGDYDIVVRDDDREVFRARLNAERPSVQINVALSGAEMSIELTEGAHGPIQDVVILERAMFLRR